MNNFFQHNIACLHFDAGQKNHEFNFILLINDSRPWLEQKISLLFHIVAPGFSASGIHDDVNLVYSQVEIVIDEDVKTAKISCQKQKDDTFENLTFSVIPKIKNHQGRQTTVKLPVARISII